MYEWELIEIINFLSNSICVMIVLIGLMLIAIMNMYYKIKNLKSEIEELTKQRIADHLRIFK